MTKLKIEFDDDCLTIFDTSEDFLLYEACGNELTRVININQSELILQLLTKTWADNATLYSVATLVNREFPENQIDWEQTFYIVERKNYLESLSDILLPKKDSTVDSLSQMVRFGMDENNEEAEEIVTKIVKDRLKDFAL